MGNAIVSVTVTVYTLVCSIGVGGPVIWMTANNAAITAVILLVFGVIFAGQGIGGLIDEIG